MTKYSNFNDMGRAINERRADEDTTETYQGAFIEASEMAKLSIVSEAEKLDMPDPEQAAHAVNAAIRHAGLEGRRKTNPVVDGRLMPRARKAHGHGPDALRKRRRDEESGAAATPSPRARRSRRAVDYAEEES